MTEIKRRTINGDPMKYSMRHEDNRLVLYRHNEKAQIEANNPECEFWYKIEELEDQLNVAEAKGFNAGIDAANKVITEKVPENLPLLFHTLSKKVESLKKD